MRRSDTISLWLALTIIGLWIAGIIGWVLNLVKIFDADFAHVTGVLVLRIIGVFIAPIGSVLGLFV